jgi:hypothetical protein
MTVRFLSNKRRWPKSVTYRAEGSAIRRGLWSNLFKRNGYATKITLTCSVFSVRWAGLFRKSANSRVRFSQCRENLRQKTLNSFAHALLIKFD